MLPVGCYNCGIEFLGRTGNTPLSIVLDVLAPFMHKRCRSALQNGLNHGKNEHRLVGGNPRDVLCCRRIDDIILFDAAPVEESRRSPRRIIFTGWFDTGKQGQEWPGDFKIVLHQKPLTWDAAESVLNKATGKPWIRVGLRGNRSLSQHTVVRFRYRLTGGKTLRVALVDRESKMRVNRELSRPTTDQWAQATIDFRFPVKEGADPFAADEVQFLIDAGATLQIDDLLIYEPAAPKPNRTRRSARVKVTRPKTFPHRIWAACDFEAQTPDYNIFDLTRRTPLLTARANDESGKRWDENNQTGLRWFEGIVDAVRAKVAGSHEHADLETVRPPHGRPSKGRPVLFQR